jgi:succinate dehydrogenase / fumarate reductase flavoprotein subunit
MARNREGLTRAVKEFGMLRDEFWQDVRIPGGMDEMNPELEKASRVADFIETGELMARDALNREESCGGHFREEFQTEEGEATRNDKDYMFVAAWEYTGTGNEPVLHKEPLDYEQIKVQTRNYKI